jgi:hypothetical protein
MGERSGEKNKKKSEHDPGNRSVYLNRDGVCALEQDSLVRPSPSEIETIEPVSTLHGSSMQKLSVRVLEDGKRVLDSASK